MSRLVASDADRRDRAVHEELIEPNNPASQSRNVGYGTGYLNLGSPESDARRLTSLRRGLNQTGYVEGRNFVIEYRWTGIQAARPPELEADLVQLQVAVNVAAGREHHRLRQLRSHAGRQVELLSEIAPGLKRAAIIFNPETAAVSN